MNTRLMIAVCLLFGFAASAAELPEPKLLDVVYWLNPTNTLVELERGEASVERSHHTTSPRYGRSIFETKLEIRGGEKSPVRIGTARPTFVVRSMVPPTYSLVLARMSVKKGTRLVVSKTSPTGPEVKGNFEKIAFDVAPNGSSYQIVVGNSLEVGEYCFLGATTYCFGVEPPTIQ